MNSYEHEPTAEKGYPKYESHEQYMRRRVEEENKKNGVHIEYNNSRLTKEIKELTARVEKLENEKRT